MRLENNWKFEVETADVKRNFPFLGAPVFYFYGSGSIYKENEQFKWFPFKNTVNLRSLDQLVIKLSDFTPVMIPFNSIRKIDICRKAHSRVYRGVVIYLSKWISCPPRKLTFECEGEICQMFVSIAVTLQNRLGNIELVDVSLY